MKEKKRERKEGESFRERDYTFSLNILVIGLVVSGGARGKELFRDKSNKSRPETWRFDKLREVGAFLLLGLFFC